MNPIIHSFGHVVGTKKFGFRFLRQMCKVANMEQQNAGTVIVKTKRPIGCFGWGAIVIFGLWALGSIFPDAGESATPAPATSTTAPAPATSTTAPSPEEPVALKNAKRTANSYLNTMAFSKKGLIEQLVYEGYDNATATLAVNSLTGVDWKQQAALSGASYLESQGFSRSGLIDQLKYEGFTTAEATYGADANGL